MLGTGTDVGKTYVTAALAAAVRHQRRVLALKPVESGVVEGEPGDAGTIARAAGHPAQLSSWRFLRGVSPHLAAREQGQTLALAPVVQWIAAAERAAGASVTLIETAGGACSPLAPGVTNIELARALEPALWVLVAPDALGVLHDVTATLRALPRKPDAVVLTAARPRDPSSGSNAGELHALGITPVLCVIARGGDAGLLADWLLAHPQLSPET
jgi:dethiobiotin synthetase